MENSAASLPNELVDAGLTDERLADASGAGVLDWLRDHTPRDMTPEQSARHGGGYWAPGVL